MVSLCDSSCQSILMSTSNAKRIRATALVYFYFVLFCCFLLFFFAGFFCNSTLNSVYWKNTFDSLHSFYFASHYYLACVKKHRTMILAEMEAAVAVAAATTKYSSVFHYRMTVIGMSIFQIVHDNFFLLSLTIAASAVVIVQPVSIDYGNLSRWCRCHHCHCCCQHLAVKYFFRQRKLWGVSFQSIFSVRISAILWCDGTCRWIDRFNLNCELKWDETIQLEN